MQNNRFEGITLSSTPKPNPDGTYTITLTPADFEIFQDNQKKQPVAVPAEKPSDDSVSVTQDPSMFQ